MIYNEYMQFCNVTLTVTTYFFTLHIHQKLFKNHATVKIRSSIFVKFVIFLVSQ